MIRRSLLAFALAAMMTAPALLAADKEEAGVLAA